jgi:hypothetical protein
MTPRITRSPKTETLTPAPDGVTTDFNFSFTYATGSTSVWLNGRRKIDTYDDGWTELGGTAVRLKEAPLAGDTVQGKAEPA